MPYPVEQDRLATAKEWQPIARALDAAGQIDLTKALDHRDTRHPWRVAYSDADDPDFSDNPCTLGLHWRRGEIAPSHFIGAVRLEFDNASQILRVAGKLRGGDYPAMFARVLASPAGESDGGLDKLFGCDADAEPIPTEAQDTGLTLLEVTAYLAATARLLRRHLRQGFVQKRENLVGQVRGRILVSAQVQQNLVCGRADRMVCAFQRLELDTLENRILKLALEVAARWLRTQHAAPAGLQTWVREIRSLLAPVPDHRLHPRDWTRLRKTGLMAAYARPLALARLVLTRLHINANGAAEARAQTLPFFLDANRLFEGWVGVCLEAAGATPQAQRQRSLRLCTGYEAVHIRPDFICAENQHTIVVDAKYKLGLQRLERCDFYQVLSYARLIPKVGECWLAIPEQPAEDHQTTQQALERFRARWEDRDGQALCNYRWKEDGLRLGIIEVPWPRTSTAITR